MASLVLFDSQLQPGSTPDSFSWSESSQDTKPYLSFYGTGGATQTPVTPGTGEPYIELITNQDSSNPNPALAGYSNYWPYANRLVNPTFINLSRTDGFSLSFRIRLKEESHSSDRNGDGLDDRAGFSVTVISSDRLGIELGFWVNEIWAQRDGTDGPLFTHSPSERAFINSSEWVNYQLKIEADQYRVSAESPDQESKIILAGKLKDYSAFNHQQAGLPYDPYEQPNFIFLGDNTRSASIALELQAISIQTNAGTLEPTGFSTALASLPGAGTLVGTPQPDRFQFLSPDPNGSLGADTITNFNGLQGDRLLFSRAVLPGVNQLSLKSVRSSKALKRALRSRTPLVYQQRSGDLFFNANGRKPGFGEAGGLLAILEGAPPLLAEHLELLAT